MRVAPVYIYTMCKMRACMICYTLGGRKYGTHNYTVKKKIGGRAIKFAAYKLCMLFPCKCSSPVSTSQHWQTDMTSSIHDSMASAAMPPHCLRTFQLPLYNYRTAWLKNNLYAQVQCIGIVLKIDSLTVG